MGEVQQRVKCFGRIAGMVFCGRHMSVIDRGLGMPEVQGTARLMIG